MVPRRKILRVEALLERAHGFQRPPPGDDPLDELIGTILSQNTSDVNSGRAYDDLKAAFPSWEGALRAPVGRIAAAIRSAGLANIKAPRIQTVLRMVWEEQGHFDISWLRRRPPEEVRAWLGRFPGIGPKTVACVMLFSLGKPAFPVDTHIYRVSGRIGLRPARMSAEQAHTYLANLLPPETYNAAHLNLIRLGREICQARRPKCEACPLTGLCDYYASLPLVEAA